MLNTTKQISYIHQKLLYLKNIIPINVGYTYCGSMFDNTIKYISSSSNIRYIEHGSTSNVPYHMLMVNNPIEFSSSNEIHNPLNKIFLFHDNSILKMKKEDLYIFNEKTQNYNKYTFNERICEMVPSIKYVRYGFEKKSNNISIKNKDILLIGNGQNIETVIYHQIKEKFNNIDILNTKNIHSMNIDIGSLLEDYKICICMSLKYNRLLAASNGCFVISFENDEEIPHYYKAGNLDDILTHCYNILSNYGNYSKHHTEISETICNYYDFDNFTKSINTIIENALL